MKTDSIWLFSTSYMLTLLWSHKNPVGGRNNSVVADFCLPTVYPSPFTPPPPPRACSQAIFHGWLPAIFDCLFVFVVLALTKQALILQFNTLLRKLRFTFIERKMRNDHISPLPTPHALKLNLYHLDRGENLKISDFKIPWSQKSQKKLSEKKSKWNKIE